MRYDTENWKIGNIDVNTDIIENLLNFVKNLSYIYWMSLGKQKKLEDFKKKYFTIKPFPIMNMLREINREGFGQDFFGPSHTFCSTSGQGTGSDVGIPKIMKELSLSSFK